MCHDLLPFLALLLTLAQFEVGSEDILSSLYKKMSDCANLVIRRYDDESSDYSNLPHYLTTIYGLRG